MGACTWQQAAGMQKKRGHAGLLPSRARTDLPGSAEREPTLQL